MGLSRIFTSKFCLFLAVFALISTPAMAQLSVSTNSLPFFWTTGTLLPQPQTVQVTGVTSFTASLIEGNVNLFLISPGSNFVNVNINGSTVPSVPNGEYSATLRIQAGTETKDVTLTLNKGGSLTLNVSEPSVFFFIGSGSTGQQTRQVLVTPSPAVQVGYTTSVVTGSGVNWLSVNPPSGQLAGTGGYITIQVNPSLVQASDTGTVTINAGGAQAQITVTLTAGTGGGAVQVTPAAMTFAYTTGGLLPASQPLNIYAPATTIVSATASSGTVLTPWLLVNGLQYTGDISIAGGTSSSLAVSVHPGALTTGTYNGQITVTAGGATQAIVYVTLNVNTGSGIYVAPGTLAFSSPGGVTQQAVNVSYSGDQTGLTYTATPYSNGWLTVSPTSGAVNTQFFAYVNAAGLSAGTHTGYITVSVPGANFSQNVAVTLTVGGGGTGGVAFGVGPTSLAFTAQAGAAVSAQPVAVNGPANQVFTASVTGGASWLILNTTTGVTPGQLSVSVNPAAVGLGSHSGSILVSSASGTAPVYVTLNVQAEPVLVANPGGLVITYDPAAGTGGGAQYIQLASSAPTITAFTYAASSATPWLASGVFGTGATDSGDPRILIVPNMSNLTAGVHSGSITVTGTARATGAQSALTIPVTVIVTGTGSLTFSPASLAFTANQGVNPAAQSISVSSATSTVFSASATTSDGGGWLQVTPSSGMTPATLSVSVLSAAMVPGTYSGTINVAAGGATQQIPVSLTVGAVAAATLVVDNVAFSFTYQQGGAIPAAKHLAVGSGGSQINITAAASTTDGRNWLSVSPGSGSTPATLSVSVNPAGLAPGIYNGTVSVSSPSASNSPQNRNVTLEVRAAPVLSLGANTLTFTSREGAVPGSQTLSVASSGDPISFSVSAGATSWLRVSPATATTPATISVSVNPAGLAPRTYTGQIVVEATDGNPSRQTVEVTLLVTAPLPTITRVTHAASYREGPVAPGELVVLFGSAMGPDELAQMQLDADGRVSRNLSGVRVLFSGIEAPMIYASGSQVSAVVPYAMTGRRTATVQLEYRGVRSNSVTVDVASAAPGIFTLNASGSGAGVVLNQDYSVNSSGNAAARGSIVIVYATGEGQCVPLGVDGRVNSDPNSLPRPLLDVTATIDGQPAVVHYAGAAPGMVSGVLQLNIEVPVTSGTGNVPLAITIGGASSQPGVTLAVR